MVIENIDIDATLKKARQLIDEDKQARGYLPLLTPPFNLLHQPVQQPVGLGNIGAVAGKPVMEGKGALFKKFADIDVFDIEVNSEDPDEFIRTCELISPTFGGINL